MDDSLVPIAHSISDIYSENILEQAVRYKKLCDQFKEIYNEYPTFIARAPGRVNIIGEHIDYCGMPVFPMAIELDTIIAVSTNDSQTVNIANAISSKYPPISFNFSPENIVEIDDTVHDWGNYFKCGYKGSLEHLKIDNPKGMNCLVDGVVPVGSGLSSSSAFVSCTAMATLKANGAPLDKKVIVDLSVASERYVGVNGGGMDQTCSVMAKKSSAVFIEFYPSLKTTPVQFPKTDPEISFVIANTLVVSNKQVTAPVCYNLRVVETRIAALIMAKLLGIDKVSTCQNADPLTLKIVMDEYSQSQNLSDEDPVKQWISRLEKMLSFVEKFFGDHQDGHTWEECANLLNLSIEEMKLKVHTDKFPVRAEKLMLYKRSKHVFGETLRVVEFRQTCESQGSSAGALQQLGELMNQSQESCDKLFDCSCPEINELCSIARKHGATGSRLTGAGWGGCTISMVPSDKVDSFIASLKSEFYAKHHPSLTEDELQDIVFSTKPATEQLNFINDENNLNENDLNQLLLIPEDGNSSTIDFLEETKEENVFVYAKIVFDQRDFMKAQYILRNCTSNKSLFLKWYSCFLNIEKAELEGTADKGLIYNKLGNKSKALKLFIKSVNVYQYNWTAWLMIEGCIGSEENPVYIYEYTKNSIAKTAFMAHLSLQFQSVFNGLDSGNEFSENLYHLKTFFSDSPFVMGLETLYYYNIREFEKAENLLESIYRINPYNFSFVDTHSNILYVRGDDEKLSQLAKRCSEHNKNRPETCCVIGNYYSMQSEHEKSVLYFERALKLNPEYYTVWTLLGHEYINMKNTSRAINAYRRAVSLNQRDYKAWYGLGLTYELLKLPEYSKYYFHKALTIRPDDHRILIALANSYESTNQIQEAIECYKVILFESPEEKFNSLQKLALLYDQNGQKSHASQYHKVLLSHYISLERDAIIDQNYHNNQNPKHFNRGESELDSESETISDLETEDSKEERFVKMISRFGKIERHLYSAARLNNPEYTANSISELMSFDELASQSLLYLAKYELEKNNALLAKGYLHLLVTSSPDYEEIGQNMLLSIEK
ncbi:hypothetical protein BB560_005256 [Smittium megazygosporum]|uniref:Galactokinase n=1 Tax=Smittium megazygosporum TaxID=133381 RepID=A0A2T9Z707_9FUNG|nr:hypothetical protein BB560_005256 [Smittium megazygosporum]